MNFLDIDVPTLE
ncbi:hypothetical protein NXF25_004905 [Crotalus adamanteus]|uniref:Uncharacterized protein n=1 Tax=Crotalus adamanteus TaxID=8729 RepID=A0AAW1BWD2_CROAD